MTRWARILGHQNYEVSDTGQVRSVDRIVRCKNGTAKKRGVSLRAWECKGTGYSQVMLGDRKKHSVHRLVAEAFLVRPCGKDWINHKNGIRNDNRVENLEWCTPSENAKHCFNVLHPDARTYLGKFSSEHPTSKAVISTNMATGKETRYECALDAVRLGVGFDSASISRCCNGINAYHNGHYWRFAYDVALNDQEREAA